MIDCWLESLSLYRLSELFVIQLVSLKGEQRFRIVLRSVWRTASSFRYSTYTTHRITLDSFCEFLQLWVFFILCTAKINFKILFNHTHTHTHTHSHSLFILSTMSNTCIYYYFDSSHHWMFFISKYTQLNDISHFELNLTQ